MHGNRKLPSGQKFCTNGRRISLNCVFHDFDRQSVVVNGSVFPPCQTLGPAHSRESATGHSFRRPQPRPSSAAERSGVPG
jgi:hypothetical protein